MESIQHETQVHPQGIEHRANALVSELQATHQKELAQVQDVAQQAFRDAQQAMNDSQQRLQVSEAGNQV